MIAALLAQLPFLHSTREALTSGPSRGEVVAFILSVLGFVALIALAIWWTRRRHRRRRIDYLTAAVDVAGLSEQDRRDLRFVAQHAVVRYPASMLLTPANFDRAIQPALEAAPQPDALKARLHDLRTRLFGDESEAPSAPATEPDTSF